MQVAPMLKGFDVCAFMICTPDQMMTVAARCVELGIAHGDVHDRGELGIAMEVADPDVTVLRFVAGPHWTIGHHHRTGVRGWAADPL